MTHRITFAMTDAMTRRHYRAAGVSLALTGKAMTAIECYSLGLRWMETKLRRDCAERGESFDALGREWAGRVGYVKRGPRLQVILGVVPDDVKPRASGAGFSGRSSGPEFAPDVDDIDPREFDSE